MKVKNFDFRRECAKAGIDVNDVYEPYKHARSRIITAGYLQNPPSEIDVALITKLETEYPLIRELADRHLAWVQNTKGGLKERLSH